MRDRRASQRNTACRVVTSAFVTGSVRCFDSSVVLFVCLLLQPYIYNELLQCCCVLINALSFCVFRNNIHRLGKTMNLRYIHSAHVLAVKYSSRFVLYSDETRI